ncbi:hypothetical protein [Flavobacterium limnosediminis]|uniref:hypothetical protein n=1 Tax=Flavobacterium limnosediminis TaxID=1401027 RepID=UPI000418507C|nr:hypothetical protein [Flavobacterium limnosediminis]
MVINAISYSQIKTVETEKLIEIGKVGALGSKSVWIEKSENKYLFSYNDIKFQQITNIKSFAFQNLDNDFEKLYDKIMNGFNEIPSEDIMLELPNDIIWLHYEKNMGIISFQFRHAVNKNSEVIGFSQFMTKKQIAKLFGKKI